jgi:hypothetical protein
MFNLSSFSWNCFAVSLALNVSRGVSLVNSALKNILKNNIQVSQKQACLKVHKRENFLGSYFKYIQSCFIVTDA